MKSSRKFFILTIVMAIFAMATGCQYIESPVEAIPPSGGQTLMLKVNGQPLAVGDTLKLEKGVTAIFQISLPRLKTATTTFHDNGVVLAGAIISHTFSVNASFTSFTIVATDSSNAVHERTVFVSLGFNQNLPMYYAFGKNQVGSKWEYKLLFLKTPLDAYPGAYGYVGNVTDPSWINHPVNPADTNKVFSNGQVSDAPSGERGLYVMVQLPPLSPGNYTIAFYKGNIWGPYGDSNKVKFSISDNGDLTWSGQTTTPVLPGDIGDWSVRFGLMDSTKITIFVNNAAAFSQPYFIRLQNAAGVFQAPINQTPVANAGDWGKIEISGGIFPASGTIKLSFNYGSNINSPLVFNTKANESTFYYPPERVIKVIIQKVDPLKKAGLNTALKWTVEKI